MQKAILAQENLIVAPGTIVSLITNKNGEICGAKLENECDIYATSVVLTTGTFLNGMIHIGEKTIPAGRVGEAPSLGLANFLSSLGLAMGRLKTGTPPRLERNSIDWQSLEAQFGDEVPEPFSSLTKTIENEQVECRLSWTNKEVHQIIKKKIMRFSDRERHQIFLEPEGLDDETIYPNGISTSLPEDVQRDFISKIPGLERVKILRPGYAIAYDFVDPRECSASLELRKIPGLFLAGQINGTTGYEEAAGQGVIAGINAANKARKASAFILDRADAYLGVMIDDLVTRGAPEPYRMFTSRAEYRLRLRADNADQRLTEMGYKLGVVKEKRWKLFFKKKQALIKGEQVLSKLNVTPNEAIKHGFHIRKDGIRRNGIELLSFPEITIDDLFKIWPKLKMLSKSVKRQLEIECKYKVYIERQKADILSYRRDSAIQIPSDLDFNLVGSLSNEAKEIFLKARPETIAQAASLPGITPAAIGAMVVYLRSKAA
jgi:tRNA uridine 5-carboxymethylaminomethyl modification enzyme